MVIFDAVIGSSMFDFDNGLKRIIPKIGIYGLGGININYVGVHTFVVRMRDSIY